MKKKSLTLKELEKSWWWNRKEIRRDGVKGVDWPTVEEAARNYELMRRASKGKKFKKTYLELFREEKQIVHVLWVNWKQLPYRFAVNRSQFREIGWTPVYEHQNTQWNLRLTDKKLMDEFLRQIRAFREIQKIPRPRCNQGEKHRGVSWNLIEVLDRKHNCVGTLSDSERHTATVAQCRAEKYFTEYERALAKWHEGSQNPAFYVENEDESDETDQSE